MEGVLRKRVHFLESCTIVCQRKRVTANSLLIFVFLFSFKAVKLSSLMLNQEHVISVFYDENTKNLQTCFQIFTLYNLYKYICLSIIHLMSLSGDATVVNNHTSNIRYNTFGNSSGVY